MHRRVRRHPICSGYRRGSSRICDAAHSRLRSQACRHRRSSSQTGACANLRVGEDGAVQFSGFAGVADKIIPDAEISPTQIGPRVNRDVAIRFILEPRGREARVQNPFRSKFPAQPAARENRIFVLRNQPRCRKQTATSSCRDRCRQ